MAKYIDVEPLIKDGWQLQRYNSGDGYAIQEHASIKDIPPADVKPVVHGRWVKVGGFFTPGGDPVWECSECGKGRHVYGVEHRSYGADVSDGQWVACPNCGADMREEAEP